VTVGELVERSGLIATLDDSDYRLRVQEAEASLAQAQAQLRNARNGHERAVQLYENGSASKQDLDAARAAFESATAQVAAIEKRLDLARLQVAYTRLEAPFAGAVAEVRVDVNENVNPGQPMILLTSRGRPEVRVSVPEVLISQVRPGSAVSVTFDAVAGTVLPARVTEVGVAATGLATTFPVTVRLDGDAERVRPGMAAEVTFRFETAGAAERLIVPATAVAEDQHGRYVYTLDLEGEGLGRARRVAVTVGELTSEGMEILTGLVEGDLVVTAGVSRIADGQRVRLL
jgi:multidrug efflux system membrane fusion protein